MTKKRNQGSGKGPNLAALKVSCKTKQKRSAGFDSRANERATEIQDCKTIYIFGLGREREEEVYQQILAALPKKLRAKIHSAKLVGERDTKRRYEVIMAQKKGQALAFLTESLPMEWQVGHKGDWLKHKEFQKQPSKAKQLPPKRDSKGSKVQSQPVKASLVPAKAKSKATEGNTETKSKSKARAKSKAKSEEKPRAKPEAKPAKAKSKVGNAKPHKADLCTKALEAKPTTLQAKTRPTKAKPQPAKAKPKDIKAGSQPSIQGCGASKKKSQKSKAGLERQPEKLSKLQGVQKLKKRTY